MKSNIRHYASQSKEINDQIMVKCIEEASKSKELLQLTISYGFQPYLTYLTDGKNRDRVYSNKIGEFYLKFLIKEWMLAIDKNMNQNYTKLSFKNDLRIIKNILLHKEFIKHCLNDFRKGPRGINDILPPEDFGFLSIELASTGKIAHLSINDKIAHFLSTGNIARLSKNDQITLFALVTKIANLMSIDKIDILASINEMDHLFLINDGNPLTYIHQINHLPIDDKDKANLPVYIEGINISELIDKIKHLSIDDKANAYTENIDIAALINEINNLSIDDKANIIEKIANLASIDKMALSASISKINFLTSVDKIALLAEKFFFEIFAVKKYNKPDIFGNQHIMHQIGFYLTDFETFRELVIKSYLNEAEIIEEIEKNIPIMRDNLRNAIKANDKKEVKYILSNMDAKHFDEIKQELEEYVKKMPLNDKEYYENRLKSKKNETSKSKDILKLDSRNLRKIKEKFTKQDNMVEDSDRLPTSPDSNIMFPDLKRQKQI